MRFVYVIPIGSFLLGLFVFGSIGTLGDRPPDPEEINLNTELDYNRMAEGYAAQGKKQIALDTCAAMTKEYGSSSADRCALDVYESFNDLNNVIRLYERQRDEELADGDSAEWVTRIIEELKEERGRTK